MISDNALEAVTAAYHVWMTNDGIEVDLVQAQGGLLTSADVSGIGRLYSITRTLPKRTAAKVADEINTLRGSLKADGLVKTAEACAAAAAAIAGLLPAQPDRKKKPTVPYSAVSKLLWFARPAGWTMYDSFASKGLKARGSGKDRFLDFYRRLESANFDNTIRHVRPKLQEQQLPALLAERIIDYELMRRGGRKGYHPAEAWTAAALRTFGGDVRARLHRFAEAVAPDLSTFATEVQ